MMNRKYTQMMGERIRRWPALVLAGVLAAGMMAVPVCAAEEASEAVSEAVSEDAAEAVSEGAGAAEGLSEEEAQAVLDEVLDEVLDGADGTLAQVLEDGVIVIAMEGDWAPWSYHDEEDVLTGYDAEVARAIAGKLGVEAELVEAPWESLFAGLDSGRYNLVVNGVDYTEERAEKYDFSTPYAYNRTALIVRSDNNEITSFEDLEGKTTANSISSTYMTLAESYGAEATGVSTLNETLQLVLSGRVDATLNAEVSYYDYMSVHPDAELKIAAIHEDVTNVCIPMAKGEENESLLEAVNAALDCLRADGTLSSLSEQFFGTDISVND